MIVADFGPLYAETVPGRFPVEPWNTYSNVVFLVTLLYFAWKTGLRRSQHPLIVLGLPILLVGFIGGTLYHATRSSAVWLFMDFLPISILALFAAMYYWLQVIPHRVWATTAFALTLCAGFALRHLLPLPRSLAVSFGYLTLALGILVPVILYCGKNRWKHFSLIGLSILSFALAISFRVLDRSAIDYVSMGTHFLWHIFGGVSTFLLLLYTYRADLDRTT